MNSLEEKLEWVLLNQEVAKEIGKNGRRKAVTRFSYNALEKTVQESILKLIK